MKRIFTSALHDHIDEEVRLAGWVDNRRDHGKLIFLDLRDLGGKVQMVALPNNQEVQNEADRVRPEWVIEVTGKVNKRPEKMVNIEEPNGDIEIQITSFTVLREAETPPFDVSTDGYEIGEEHRMQHRYLDLRRPRMKKNLIHRHEINKFIRNFLSERDFFEVETPYLSKSTPEGARDYIVPSRTYPGQFYALPQSPQQYKQLLMVAGIERYFQLARCFRDEDTRKDRQAEFTQLDLEMSFPTQDDILELTEELFTKLVETIYPQKHVTQTPWPRLDYHEVMEKYGTDAPDLRKNPEDPDELAFCWIVNFPLFEEEKEGEYFAPSHHMFTAPKEEDLEKLESDPHSVRSYQHDLVLNGFEIAGGSVRIHDPEVQRKIFNLIGFSKERADAFEHLLTAFKYGVPPHGGIASGLDRVMAILENEDNIREVIAFPKTGEGRDLMMDAPAEVEQEQLDELHIGVKKPKE